MSNKWTWARNENQEIWPNSQFDSREDAIKEGRAQLQNENKLEEEYEEAIYYEKFYIGKCQPYIPGPPCADLILERMGDRMCDEFELDLVEEYMMNINIEEMNLLQDKIDKAWNEWLEETNNYPTMYKIIDIEEINVYLEK